MQDSNIGRLTRARQLAIAICAAAALLAGTAATASNSGTRARDSASLQWTAPTTYTDGSALTDLAGYHIYYGRSPSSMTATITVASPGTTSYTIANLGSGTWYFAMNAYTTSGAESALTNTDSKAVP